MRTLGKIAATLGVIGAIAVGSVVPAAAWYVDHGFVSFSLGLAGHSDLLVSRDAVGRC